MVAGTIVEVNSEERGVLLCGVDRGVGHCMLINDVPEDVKKCAAE